MEVDYDASNPYTEMLFSSIDHTASAVSVVWWLILTFTERKNFARYILQH